MITNIPDTAFGKNDIRGIYGKDVTEELFYYTGKGFVKYMAEHSQKDPSDMWITVTQDARNHSPSLAKALIDGVISTGVNVVDLGLAPTPIGYYSEVVGIDPRVTDGNEIVGALIVTASHNPSQYNGLKMTFDKQSLNEIQIGEVKTLTFKEIGKTPLPTTAGVVKQFDLIPDYTKVMINNFGRIGEGVKVVVDSANATGGVVAPNLYRALGCEVVELYSAPNGNFPNHHPNPSDESTLTDIGGNAIMYKTGHGYIKSKMKETGAILAGEMSGHIFFKDRYHGFDDAVYAGCRIIEIVANLKKEDPNFKVEQLLTAFDKVFSSQEVRFPCANELKKSTLQAFEKLVKNNPDLFGSKIKEVVTLDGLRIIFDGGFALIRQSNTEPVFTLRFEAKDKAQAEHYQEIMVSSLKNILA